MTSSAMSWSVLVVVVFVSSTFCCQERLDSLVHASIGGAVGLSTDVQEECNSRVGHFTGTHLAIYKNIINLSLRLAWQYMPIASNFGRDTVQLLGFQKVFKQMSKQRFDDAKKMIKYVTQRGGSLRDAIKVDIPSADKLHLDSLPALGKALSDAKLMYYELATLHDRALCITPMTSGDPACGHDPDLAHHLRHRLSEEVERVHQLSLHTNQLAGMFTSNERSLAEHTFDQHLFK